LIKETFTLGVNLYNFTRHLKILRIKLQNARNLALWQQRALAMAAGLTDHIWTVEELLAIVFVPPRTNS
jgi:hypothetical protein